MISTFQKSDREDEKLWKETDALHHLLLCCEDQSLERRQHEQQRDLQVSHKNMRRDCGDGGDEGVFADD